VEDDPVSCIGYEDIWQFVFGVLSRAARCSRMLTEIWALQGVDGIGRTSRTCMGQHSEANVFFILVFFGVI
jgi:hypothetical protein